MSKPMSHCDRAGAPRRHLVPRRAAMAVAVALAAALPLGALPATTNLSAVPLPTFTVGSSVDIKPNIMMILDDSGSMDWDYLPDWVNDLPSNYTIPQPGMGQDTWSIDTNSNNGYGWPTEPHAPGYWLPNANGGTYAGIPQFLYFNAAFNGVAYNPAVTYKPPVTFTSAGAKDNSSYPAMDGMSTAGGADTSLTKPNWAKVPNDGFKVQYPYTNAFNTNVHGSATSTTDLTNNRFTYFYTAVAGEYCDSPAMTNCQAGTAISGKFAYAAPLRWCSDAALTTCQGLHTSTYKYPRFPWPRITKFTVTAANNGVVTGLKVDSLQIMSGSTGSTSNTSTLASAVAAKINDCRYVKTGSCDVVGYFANVSSNVVTIYAPGVPVNTPAFTNTGTVTATLPKFAQDKVPLADFAPSSAIRSTNTVPGENLRTVLTSSVNSYPYPGTATKASTRSDCAGTTCTFAEEMQNYANWWAYYRTRMQMMKSSTSLAFSTLDKQDDIDAGTTRYRVGYFSINNNTGTDFVNVTDFDKNQKMPWFSKLFKAFPNNGTGLRDALSAAGRIYSGVLNTKTFNGVTVVDPVQYSCQKNFTILSTDGYWNGGNGYKLDGSTDVGNADGTYARPYSDGSSTKLQSSKSTLQKRSEQQVAEKGTLVKQITQMTMSTSTLQSQTAQVQQSTWPLLKVTAQLQQSTSTLQKQSGTLQSRTSTLLKSTSALQQSTSSLQQSTSKLQSSTSNLQQSTSSLQSSTSNLQTATSTLQQATSTLQKLTLQLQRSTNSGNTWSNVSSCNTNTGLCRYTTTATANVSSCTVNKSSGGGTWTIGTGTDCVYTAWSTPTTVTTCSPVAQNIASVGTAVQCSYSAFGSPSTVTSCTPKAQDTTGWSVPVARQCSYSAFSAYSTVTSCTPKAQDTTGWSVPVATQCAYAAWTSPATATSCTPKAQDLTGFSVAVASQCSYAAYTTPATATSCTPKAQDTTGWSVAVATQCSYGTWTTPSTVTSCTPKAQDTTGWSVATASQCSYAAWTALSNVTSCTPKAQDTTGWSVPVASQCSYAAWTTPTGNTSCTPAAQDTTNFSVGTATQCSYTAWSSWTTATSCTYQNQSTSGAFAATATQCQYTWGAVSTPTSCTAVAPTTSTADTTVYAASPVLCTYTAPTAPVNVSSCTYQNPSAGPTNYTVATASYCSYANVSAPTPAATCTYKAMTTSTANNTAYNANPTVCSYGAATAPTTVSSCTYINKTTSTADTTVYNPNATTCTYAPYSAYANASSCTFAAAATSTADNTAYKTATNCTYTPWTTAVDAATCTAAAQSTSPNYTVGNAVTCTPRIVQAYATATSCTPNTDVNGRTVSCDYTWAASAGTQTCAPAFATGNYSNATVYRNCATTAGNNNWVNATTCTNTSATPDATGNYTNCQYTGWTSFADDASCKDVAQDTGPAYTVPNAVQCKTILVSGGTSNTLADIAAYYYNTDLRDASQTAPDKTGTCTSALKDSNNNAFDLCQNNVPAFGRDVNTKQHMTTHTLGLGATGYMVFSPYQNDLNGNRTYVPDYWSQLTGDFYSVMSGATASPSTGICPWQSSTSGACNWPTPSNDSPANIDDLWHTAVNGHGTYFSATDPASLSGALTNVLGQITNTPRPGTAAAAASSNPNITSSDNYVFSSSYRSVDWYGELIMQRFNTDGSLTPQQWSAMRLMDCNMTAWQANRKYAVGDVYNDGSGNCWLATAAYTSGASFSTSTDGASAGKLASGPITRKIYTVSGGSLVTFDNANLDATQKTWFSEPYITSGSATGGLSQFCSGPSCLSAAQQTAASGQPLIDYLKGVRTNEGIYFRGRSHILGDIVSSEARYVKVPLQNYSDPGYSGFQTAMATRLPTVYVGGNDGMLHAFDALTGQERWAFIPPTVLPDLYHLADLNYTANHRYYVDGTPEVADICPKAPAATCSSTEWKTILVGGLNQGGKSFYALDITDPASPKFLYEYTDANMGFSYSNPRIGKLGGTGSNKGLWTVMVASGYNNIGDGKGHLFVINAYTGAAISDIVDSSGSATTPSGLARIAARSPTAATDNTIEEVYGGDLNGNVWRFDVNDTIGTAGKDAQLLIQLQDASNNPQPITAKPTVSSIPNSTLPLVIIGTGRYLGTTDLKDTSQNSIYAIKDSLTASTMTTPRAAGSNFVQQTLTDTTCPADAATNTCIQGQTVRTSSNLPVDWSAKNGWYLDFVLGGERSVTDATLALGTLVFTTIKPQTATADQIAGCTAADTDLNAKSYLYYLNYQTGGAVDGTKNVVGEELCTCIATRPSVVKTVSGNVEGIIRTSGGGSDPTSNGDGTGTSGGVGTGTDANGNPIGGSTDMGNTKRQDLPYNNAGGAARRIGWRELNGE